jgi:ankyrin repeat protein
MSEPLPERIDLRQLRLQAKELLSALHRDDPEASQLASSQDTSLQPSQAKLADAQRLLARKYGFSSWPKLVEKLETPLLLDELRTALQGGDPVRLEKLLKSKAALRKQLNEPIMSFDSPPIVALSRHPKAAEILPILVKYGADPNARSKWWAGSFSALDGATGDTVDVLLQLGAKFDVWSAAAHGKIELLTSLLDADPSLVNAPGGDGERPLHFASTAEVAELLIAHGADLELRDVDHESTPIQYQVNNHEVVRVLLKHGATPDVFTAVALNDAPLLEKILKDDPSAAMSRVGQAPFTTVTSNGGHIYAYRLGPGKTPHQVAAQNGSSDVLKILEPYSSPARRLVTAAWLQNEAAVDSLLRADPNAAAHAEPSDANAIALAAQDGRTETVRLLLKAGFDPLAPGMDSGTALHVASWFGWLNVVKLLASRVPLDLGDAHHGSPPLGWATHGAQWCRNPAGDYVAVVEELIKAGADPNAAANSGGTSMLKQAGHREDVKAVLKSHGAR